MPVGVRRAAHVLSFIAPEYFFVRGQGLRSLPTTRFSSSTFTLFLFGGSLLKPNSRKKGTLISLIIKGLLGNLDKRQESFPSLLSLGGVGVQGT